MRLIMSRYARSWPFQSRLVVSTLSIASNDFSARGIIASDSFSGSEKKLSSALVVVVDRLVERLQLVAADRRRPRGSRRPCGRVSRLERDEALDGLDDLLPLLGLGVEVEHLLQQLVVVRARPRAPRGTPRSPSAGSAASRGRCRRSRRGAGPSPCRCAVAIRPRLAWTTASQSPCCCCRSMTACKRLAVGRIDLERLLEHVERLLALTQGLANHAEPVVDADDVRLVLTVAVLDQDGLVDLPGVVPVLHLEQQVGAADQRRQIRRVDVVGGLVVAERLLEVAELVGASARRGSRAR